MKKLDMDKIAKGLGAKRRGKVISTGGHFGAEQLLADVDSRFIEKKTDELDEREAEALIRPARRASSRG